MIRYEDLLADTDRHLGRLFQWLDLDVPPQGLAAVIAPRSFEAVPEEKRGRGKFHRAATPGLWRENLSAGEQQMVARIIGSALVELGYDA